MSKNIKSLKFEQALGKLEELVEKMEDENITLEDSIAFFEEGMALSQHCEEKLNEAQAKVEILLKENEPNDSGVGDS